MRQRKEPVGDVSLEDVVALLPCTQGLQAPARASSARPALVDVGQPHAIDRVDNSEAGSRALENDEAQGEAGWGAMHPY